MGIMRRVPGKDRAPFDKAMADLNATNVKVGWFSSSRYADDNQTPVAYVAAINELGPNARPFMRPTADREEPNWAALMGQLSKRIATGKMTAEQALDAIGNLVSADIRKTISEIDSPKLSLITLMARKARLDGKKVTGATIGQFAAQIKEQGEAAIRAGLGGISEKPLNDTGYVLATCTYVVEKGNKS